MRKIHVVVLDTFENEVEAVAFRAAAISRLRSEHPAVIVHVDLVRSLWEPVVLHAYGFGGVDKTRAEEAAGRSIAEMLGNLAEDPSSASDPCESSSRDDRDLSSAEEAEKCEKTHRSDST